MQTKLTLTMEPELIESIKKYAKAEGRSVSDIVRNYFRYISGGFRTKNKISIKSETPITDKLAGSLKMPANFDYDYKKAIREAVMERHSK